MTSIDTADHSGGGGGGASITSAATFSALHTDIVEAHILHRLDGPSLASTACCCTTLSLISTRRGLWTQLCRSAWPSIATSPFLLRLVSDEPRGFFSLASSAIVSIPCSSPPPTSPPSELISAVDIFYRGNPIFSKVQETETVTSWFKCSPFRIDMLGTKESVPTNVELATSDGAAEQSFGKHMALSWLLIDPEGRRVMNLSSQEPISVQRHWLTGEVQLKYAVILGGVQCVAVVNCGGAGNNNNNNGGGSKAVMVKEVSLEMEDMEGTHLNGRDSLGIIQRAFRGKMGRGGKNRAEWCKKAYNDYLSEKRVRRERQLRTEGVLDVLAGAFLVFGFVAFLWFVIQG